jgi:hypothetical protein
MKIHLTKTDINQGIKRAMSDVVKEADTNKTGIIYDVEVSKFSGSGSAMLKKAYAYARHIEGGTEGDDFVQLKTMEKALKNLGAALKKLADTKGNKNHVLDGNEFQGNAGQGSTAASALARWINATK